MLPSAVSATGGATLTPPLTPALTPDITAPTIGGGSTPTSLIGETRDNPFDPTPPVGGIFGSASVSRSRVRHSNPPTSPLNLIGKIEGWGVGPATPVSDVTIKLSAATGAQLKELLKKLPDGMTFELSLEKEEGA